MGAHGGQDLLEGLRGRGPPRPAARPRWRRPRRPRQSSSRAGTLPVGVVAERQLLGVGEPGEHPLPRRRRVEQQQAPHPEPRGGPGLPLARQHHEVDAVAAVDEGRVALRPPARRSASRTSRAGCRSPTAVRPVRSIAAPARDIRRCTCPASCSLAGPRGPCRSPATRPRPSSTLKVIRRWSGTRVGVPLLRRDPDAGARVQHPRQLVGEPAPAAGLGLGEGRGGVVRGGHEVAAGGLGQRLEQGGREVVAQAGHLPVEALVRHLVEHLRPGCAR